jgi:hypothetical protein
MVRSPDEDSIDDGGKPRLGVKGMGLGYCRLECVELGDEGETVCWCNSRLH